MSAETTDIVLAITGLAMTIVLTLVGWMLKQGKDNMGEIARGLENTTRTIDTLVKDHAEIRVTLIGINGNNGINSEVKQLKRRITRMSRVLEAVQLTLAKDGKNILMPPE